MAECRKPNFNGAEVVVLVDNITSNYHLAFSKYSDVVTSKLKEAFWKDLVEKVRSVSGILRTKDEIKKKWRDLKSQTKSREQGRRAETQMTGGGGLVRGLKDWEEKIVTVIPDELIVGIKGGVEAQPKPQAASQATPQATSQAMPQAMPQPTSQAMPQAMPQEITPTVETRIGNGEVLVHPNNVDVEVVIEKEVADETLTEVKAKKRRTSNDLIQAQCGYFESQKLLADAQKSYFLQRTRTEAIREEYFKKVVDAMEKGQRLISAIDENEM